MNALFLLALASPAPLPVQSQPTGARVNDTPPVKSHRPLQLATTNTGLASTSHYIGEGFAIVLVNESSQGMDLNGDGNISGFSFAHVVHMSDMAILNLEISPEALGSSINEKAVFLARESPSGIDLNGDGDTFDTVPHVYDSVTRSIANIGQSADFGWQISGSTLAFSTSEAAQQSDLNSDGDLADNVIVFYDVLQASQTNSFIAGSVPTTATPSRAFTGAAVTFVAIEADNGPAGTDINGDGDSSDSLYHTFLPSVGILSFNLSPGVFETVLGSSGEFVSVQASGITYVLNALNGSEASTGAFHSTSGEVAILAGGQTLFGQSEGVAGTDLNGDGDTSDTSVLQSLNPGTGAVANLGVSCLLQSGNWGNQGTLFPVQESSESTSLNGDGDQADFVVHTYSTAIGTTVNLSLANANILMGVNPSGTIGVFFASESGQGSDLNIDGDQNDNVLHLVDLTTATVTNTRLACNPSFSSQAIGERYVAFAVSEFGQFEDLNGDMDFGDSVVHILDTTTGQIASTGKSCDGAITLRGNLCGYSVSENDEGQVLNNDGDMLDSVYHLTRIE